MKILVTYNLLRDAFKELEERYDVTFPNDRKFSYEEVLHIIAPYNILCSMFNFPVDKQLIDNAPNLKLIANYAVGYDNIDVAYALSKGITVANTPDPVIDPTANLAMGLLIDVARRISDFDRHLRQGSPHRGLMHNLGTQISGKTLGILGMGRIGKALCARANACGLHVIYHNRHPLQPTEEARLNAQYVSFEHLLAQSDFLSLNAPYTPQTHHIINEQTLRAMKPSAFLINTARGALVDEQALILALQNNRIQGAALDVFENNDRPSPQLLALNNVVLTPHIGTHTADARQNMLQTVCNNVIGFIEGDRPVAKVQQP